MVRTGGGGCHPAAAPPPAPSAAAAAAAERGAGAGARGGADAAAAAAPATGDTAGASYGLPGASACAAGTAASSKGWSSGAWELWLASSAFAPRPPSRLQRRPEAGQGQRVGNLMACTWHTRQRTAMKAWLSVRCAMCSTTPNITPQLCNTQHTTNVTPSCAIHNQRHAPTQPTAHPSLRICTAAAVEIWAAISGGSTACRRLS